MPCQIGSVAQTIENNMVTLVKEFWATGRIRTDSSKIFRQAGNYCLAPYIERKGLTPICTDVTDQEQATAKLKAWISL
jgi:hypothetical protein